MGQLVSCSDPQTLASLLTLPGTHTMTLAAILMRKLTVPAICSPHQEASSDTTLTQEDIEIGLLRTIGTGLGLPGMELVPTGWAILDSRVAKARRFG
jgi:hypothetical protein